MSRLFANNRATTLSGNITALQTNIPITNGSAFPEIPGADTFFVTLDNGAGTYEILLCTAHSAGGTTLTCTRGQDGTAATTWSAGDLIEMRVVAKEYEEFVAETDATVNLTGDLTVDGTVSFPNVPLDVPSGGTGKQSHTTNALLVGAGTLDIAELLPAGDGTPAHVLASMDGVAWSSQSTDTVVTALVVRTALTGDPLPVAQGGTGVATLPAGEILVGNGTGDITSIPTGNIASLADTVFLREVHRFTSSDSYVPTAGCYISVVMSGGGGGGGGGGAGDTNPVGGYASGGTGGAGGAGTWTAFWYGPFDNSPPTITVTVGTGGAGGAAGLAGSTGVTSSITSVSPAINVSSSGGTGGAAGGAGSNGVNGSTGASGSAGSSSGAVDPIADGKHVPFIPTPTINSIPSESVGASGAGGAGQQVNSSGVVTAAAQAGTAGGTGFVYIMEYY